MAVNANNVAVGVTGAIYRAPTGTALPTTAAAALNAAFIEVGYISEEGVQQSIGTQVSNIKAWQNGTVVRKVQTEHDLTFDFSVIELNKESLALYYGNFDDTNNKLEINAAILARFAWVIDVIDGTNKIRTVVPEAQVTSRGALSYVTSDAVKLPVTLTAYEDSAYAGTLSAPAKAYQYITGYGV